MRRDGGSRWKGKRNMWNQEWNDPEAHYRGTRQVVGARTVR